MTHPIKKAFRFTVCLITLFAIFTPSVFAITSENLNAIIERFNAMSNEVISFDCRYDNGANAIEIQLVHTDVHGKIDDVLSSQEGLLEELDGLVLQCGTIIRSILDQMNGEDVAVIVMLVSQDNVPMRMNINGADATWLLSH